MRLADRIVDILYCLQMEGSGLSLGETASRVGLPKSTTHRLLQALESRGLVVQDSLTQRYALGLGLVAMASAALQEKNILLAPSQVPMERLRNVSGETVCLHLVSGLERVCIRQVESPHAIRYTIEIGKPWPLYCGAAGKLLLAFLPDRVVNQVIDVTQLRPLTPNTITDPTRLRRELDVIRAQGYAVSFEETTPMASAVAAPIRDGNQQVIACVSLFGLRARLGDEQIAELLPELQKTSQEISNAIAPKPLDNSSSTPSKWD